MLFLPTAFQSHQPIPICSFDLENRYEDMCNAYYVSEDDEGYYAVNSSVAWQELGLGYIFDRYTTNHTISFDLRNSDVSGYDSQVKDHFGNNGGWHFDAGGDIHLIATSIYGVDWVDNEEEALGFKHTPIPKYYEPAEEDLKCTDTNVLYLVGENFLHRSRPNKTPDTIRNRKFMRVNFDLKRSGDPPFVDDGGEMFKRKWEG